MQQAFSDTALIIELWKKKIFLNFMYVTTYAIQTRHSET